MANPKNPLEQFVSSAGKAVSNFVSNISHPQPSIPQSQPINWGNVVNNIGNAVHSWQQASQEAAPYTSHNPLTAFQHFSDAVNSPEGNAKLLKFTQNPVGYKVMEGAAGLQSLMDKIPEFNVHQYIPKNIPAPVQLPFKLVAGIPEAILNVPYDIHQAGTTIGNDALEHKLNNTRVQIADYAQAALPIATIATLGTATAPEGILRSGLKGNVLRDLLTGVKTGTGYGTGFGALQGLVSGKDITNPIDYLTNLGTNTAVGAVGGAVLGGTLAGIKDTPQILKMFDSKTLQAEPVKAYTDAAAKVVENTPKPEEIAKTAFDQTQKTGGVTINLAGDQPKEGLSYSPYPDRSVIVPKENLSPTTYQDFATKNHDLLNQQGHYMGGWIDENGQTFLDVSIIEKDATKAMADAIDKKQLALYNLGTGEEVFTPLSPQYEQKINVSNLDTGQNSATDIGGSIAGNPEIPGSAVPASEPGPQPTIGEPTVGEPASGTLTPGQSVTPDNITPQPEGLKTPVGEISTADLQARVTKGNSRFHDSYVAELNKRGLSVPPEEGIKERGHIETVRQNENIRPGVRQQVAGTYKMETDEGAISYGRDVVKNNPNDAERQAMLPGPLTREKLGISFAVHEDLSLKADAAEKAGNMMEAKALDARITALENYVGDQLTPVAQTLQLAHLWSQKSPEAMVRWAQGIHDEANKVSNLSPVRLYKKITGGNWEISLSPERLDEIRTQMRAISRMPQGRERQAATLSLMRDIVKDIPPSVMQYTDAYRYQNMLINPLTQLRNTYFNTVNTFALRPVTIGLKGINDTAARVMGAENEGQVRDFARYYQGLMNGIKPAIDEFKNAMRGNDPIHQKIQETGATLSYNRATSQNVPGYLQIAGRGMEASDRFFTELIANAEYNIGKVKGLSDEEAKTKGYQTAAEFLYRKQLDPTNSTGQGALLSKIDGVTDWIIQGRNKVGPLGWFVPFVRVPMAVAKMSLEYNPITGPVTLLGAADKSSQVAKMELGSLFFALGASAALKGDTTWAAPSDPKQKQAFYDSGRKPFSVKINFPVIGEKWVPYQYLGPLSLNYALPAAYQWYEKENRTATTDSTGKKLFNVAMSALNYWSNSTPLSGLGGFVNMAEGNVDFTTATQLAFTAGQLIPGNGLLTYVANLLDPVYRNAGGTFTGQIKKGLPILSQSLPVYTNSAGEISKRTLSGSIAPYALGTPDTRFETSYKQRGAELQQNAEENAIKKQVQQEGDLSVKGASTSGGTSLKLVNNKVYYYDPVAKTAKSIDFTDLTTPKTGIDAYKQQDAIYKKAREVYDSNMSRADKNAILKQLKLDPSEVEYDYKAAQTPKTKTAYFEDKAEGQSHEWVLNRILTGRVESISGNMFVTDTMLKSFMDEGLISKSEYTNLKRIKYDSKGNQVSTGGGSGGLSASQLKLPSYPSIKVVAPDLTANKLSLSPLKPTKASTAKMPKMPTASSKQYKSGLKVGKPNISHVWSVKNLGRIV